MARNGYDVWQRFLVTPYNSSDSERRPNTTDNQIDGINESVDESRDESIEIMTTTTTPEVVTKAKQIKLKYDQKLVKTLKKLYKPDLQLIETEKGFIKHEVKPPKWVKDIIDSEPQKSPKTSSKGTKKMVNNIINGKDMNPINKKVNKKAPNKSGSVKSDKSLSTKYMTNKNINNIVITSLKKKTTPKPNHKKVNKVIQSEKQNNRIGNVVIKGFNGLIRGIGSFLGFNSEEDDY